MPAKPQAGTGTRGKSGRPSQSSLSFGRVARANSVARRSCDSGRADSRPAKELLFRGDHLFGEVLERLPKQGAAMVAGGYNGAQAPWPGRRGPIQPPVPAIGSPAGSRVCRGIRRPAELRQAASLFQVKAPQVPAEIAGSYVPPCLGHIVLLRSEMQWREQDGLQFRCISMVIC